VVLGAGWRLERDGTYGQAAPAGRVALGGGGDWGAVVIGAQEWCATGSGVEIGKIVVEIGALHRLR